MTTDAKCPKCDRVPVEDEWWLIRARWKHYIGYTFPVLKCECGTVSKWAIEDDGFVLNEVVFPRKRCG